MGRALHKCCEGLYNGIANKNSKKIETDLSFTLLYKVVVDLSMYKKKKSIMRTNTKKSVLQAYVMELFCKPNYVPPKLLVA